MSTDPEDIPTNEKIRRALIKRWQERKAGKRKPVTIREKLPDGVYARCPAPKCRVLLADAESFLIHCRFCPEYQKMARHNRGYNVQKLVSLNRKQDTGPKDGTESKNDTP